MQQNEFLPQLTAHLYSAAKANAGKAPSERELAEHFSVSRGQVREALAILEAVNVIERRAKSGIYLSSKNGGLEAMAFFARAGIPPDRRQVFEAVEVRKIHEIKAAEIAAERATEENYQELQRILDASEAELAAGRGLADLDREFHLEIVRATQNSVFHNICTTFYRVSEQRLPTYFQKPERNQRSHEDHLRIFDALKNRDADLAKALMNNHLRGALSYWSEILDADAPQ